MRGLSWLNPALYLHGARVAIAGIIRGGGSGAAWCPDWLAGPTLGPLVPALLSSRQRHAGGKESAHLEITNKLRLEAQDCCSSTMGPDATLDSVVATAERRGSPSSHLALAAGPFISNPISHQSDSCRIPQ